MSRDGVDNVEGFVSVPEFEKQMLKIYSQLK